MPRHCDSALAVAKHLAGHRAVEWVGYPLLEGNRYEALAHRYLPRGAGGILTFGVRGGAKAGERFIESVQFLSHLANVGDAKSLVIHPASTTHRQLSEDEQVPGRHAEMIRLCRAQTLDDIVWDLIRRWRARSDDALCRSAVAVGRSTIALVLLAQEGLLRLFGDSPSLVDVLEDLRGDDQRHVVRVDHPSRRGGPYLLGAAVCAMLMGWALWLQCGLGIDPCPLCSLQRIAVIAIGIAFLIAGIHNPGRLGAGIYAGLVVIIGVFGAVTAMRHVWIQSLPKDEVPACGMGLNYMLETLPLTDVLVKVFKGSGECAEAGWYLLGLAIPSWTLVFFIAMMVAAIALIRRA
jgi:disulfide bond formation protein DsbB